MADVAVPWPVGTAPGQNQQEGAGRLINVHPDTRGENAGIVWRRVPGAKVFARTPSVGAAGGTSVALGVSGVKAMIGNADGHATALGVGDVL